MIGVVTTQEGREAAAMLRRMGASCTEIGRALNVAGLGHPGQALHRSRVAVLLREYAEITTSRVLDEKVVGWETRHLLPLLPVLLELAA